jgi:hypothetical protein
VRIHRGECEITVLETGGACCVHIEPDVSNCVNVSTRDTMGCVMRANNAPRVNAHADGQPPSKRRCERVTGFETVPGHWSDPFSHFGTHPVHTPGTHPLSNLVQIALIEAAVVSRVIVAVLWPSMVCTALIDAPAPRIARDAHVRRSSRGASPFTPALARSSSAWGDPRGAGWADHPFRTTGLKPVRKDMRVPR